MSGVRRAPGPRPELATSRRYKALSSARVKLRAQFKRRWVRRLPLWPAAAVYGPGADSGPRWGRSDRRATSVSLLPKDVGRMFGGKPINVIFVCPQCSLVYVTQQERRAEDKGAGRFGCTAAERWSMLGQAFMTTQYWRLPHEPPRND